MSTLSNHLVSLWLRAFEGPENFAPIIWAYGVSLTLFGLVMLFEPALPLLASYGVYSEVGTPALWGGLTFVLGACQLVCLKRSLQRYLFAACVVAVFVWVWIALAFYISMGHLSAHQAMYGPAAVASAWLAIRTAPLS